MWQGSGGVQRLARPSAQGTRPLQSLRHHSLGCTHIVGLTKRPSLPVSLLRRSGSGTAPPPLRPFDRHPYRHLLPALQASSSEGSSSSTPSPESSPPEEEPEQRKAEPPRRSDHQSERHRWSWLPKKFKITQPIRLVFNIIAFILLMRIIPTPKSSTRIGNFILPGSDSITLRLHFSEFVKSVRKNDIATIVVDGNSLTFGYRPSSEFIKAFQKTLPDNLQKTKFIFETVKPPDYSVSYDSLVTNGVAVSAVDRRGNTLTTLLGYAFAAAVLIVVLNRVGARFPQRGAGRRHSEKSSDKETSITFDDVAGVDEAKEELQEIVEYLKDPERFSRLGARPPSGVMLVGPPGTGKTLLAKAIAGEAGVPFFSISASEFVELYVGMGALKVRELYAQARAQAPSIVFIDEIDAVAKGRESRVRGVGNDEREQTLNQLLTELDGFDTSRDGTVITIAATNRPDVLDSALLRPGRFDRRVPVERPDRTGREQILSVHIQRKGLPLAADVAVPALASQTVGFTGADLANVVNEAALLAGRAGRLQVFASDFDAAVMRSVAGLEKKRSLLRGVEKTCVARHEVGHAMVATAVAALVPTTNAVERLSIIPRSGGALGFTYSPPTEEDRALVFEDEIRGQLAMLMGGRAAEAATATAVSSGAADDIKRATELAHRSVAELGLSKVIGPLSVTALAAAGEEYSMLMDGGGMLGRSVETEVRSLCEAALQVARDTVELNSELHLKLSRQLEEKERLDGASLREALSGTLVPPSLREFVLEGRVPSSGNI